MKWRSTLLLIALTAPLWAQDRKPDPLRASQTTLAASTVADALSSRGLVEQNPMLGRGPFEMRNQGAKAFAITGGLILAEMLLVRKFPATRKAFVWVNFGASAMHAGAALHNTRVE